MNIYQQWLDAKAAERAAQERRRELEDQLISELKLPEIYEGTKSFKADSFKVKVTYRMNRSIDGEALQEIAAEYGLTDHLGALFRWKPEINAKAWKDAGDEITKPLLGAITTKPGRPSFNIETTEE